jgi:large subunit ribosomal protein L6|uniref:Large ribosomal subunit protein uL6c n=1 Tax=Pseudo-nitzschia multiseries TaxID=37319 RepID=A0A0K1DBZ9_PSEMU|nr:ribosomal protein L6 [Pseudo-nitzschia multiseries]AKT26080.1 ribosomal protein L6 [Pseudo-nitzschia multiseries]UBA15566.1 ribosomal protein L6 [Pseudo-nitzschia multiseries]
MSRIGKLPIIIPANVDVNWNGEIITVKGKFGTLETAIPQTINIQQNENIITVSLKDATRSLRSMHGLYRTLINNMVVGVSEQFEVTLILKGVGYRAAVQGKQIVLNLGYSHPVNIDVPETVSVEVVQNTTINLKSCDKELLGLFASNIRSWRRPEPYKGKGILYKNEQILRKAGKAGK